MRSLLITLVLGITALMFYSALWFKSESIEDDITSRTTQNLATAGAANIDIDVDGRHVTLTGVVYDDATETRYLDEADATYGALGPIDGLTLQADGGYVSAIKTADGITLRGTVPSADARTKLVAEAKSATDGAVDDQLIVAGPKAAWQDEATFGIGQLAGLTTGTLTAAAGSYVLSGSTDHDAEGVSAAFADRDGWNAFISSPNKEQGLSAEVDRLSAELTTGEERIGALETTVAGLQANNAALVAERDTVSAELAELTSSLNEGEATSADLRSQLTAANTTIGEKDQTIADLTGQLDDGAAKVATLETELGNRQSVLTTTEDQLTALTGNLDAANGTITDLSAMVAERDGTIADLTNQVAERDAIGAELADLKANLSEDQATSADLRSQLAAANAVIGDKDQTIADLSGQLTEGEAQIATLEAELGNRLVAFGDINEQATALTGELETAKQSIAELSGQLSARDATLSDLKGQVAERDVIIEGLTAQVANLTATADQSVTALTQELSARDGTISDLSAQLSDRDATIGSLNAQVAELDGSVASAAAQIVAITAASQAKDGDVQDLEGRVIDLTAVIAERDETIAALQARPLPTSRTAEQCAERATGVLAGSNINFETASARIAGDSVALLERLTGIALACVGDDLSVEIGGHTDAQGSDENNQALSEARAQAVLGFMADRGVPVGGLQAVGYGESQPVATNDTSAGRAQNRRITFDWQAR